MILYKPIKKVYSEEKRGRRGGKDKGG